MDLNNCFLSGTILGEIKNWTSVYGYKICQFVILISPKKQVVRGVHKEIADAVKYIHDIKSRTLVRILAYDSRQNKIASYILKYYKGKDRITFSACIASNHEKGKSRGPAGSIDFVVEAIFDPDYDGKKFRAQDRKAAAGKKTKGDAF